MTPNNYSVRAFIELTIASLLWGFGFTATVWALKGLSPSAIIFYRFVLAALIIGAIMIMSGKKRTLWRDVRRSWAAGLALGVTLLTQTWGLVYTTATKASFITTLYAIITPLLATLFFKERLSRWHWFYVGLALFGTVLLLDLKDFSIGLGDSLVFVTAFMAAVHIIIVGRVAREPTDSFAFNGGQCLWCGLLALPTMIYEDNWAPAALDPQGWLGLIFLTFGSSLIAFSLQVRAQRHVSDSVASLLFLMESPMSWGFAIYFLNEVPSLTQVIGATLILAACALTAMTQKPKPA